MAEDHEYSSRMTKIEAVVENQATSIRGLGEDIRSLAEDLHYFAETMNSHMASSGKANWGVMAAWAAVIISIVSLGASGFVRDLGKLEDGFNTVLWEETIPYLRDGEVPRLQEAVGNLEEETRRLENRLERELDRMLSDHREEVQELRTFFRQEVLEHTKNNNKDH